MQGPCVQACLEVDAGGDGGIRDRAYWFSHLVVYRSKHHQDVFGGVDFSSARISLFATSGGSGMGKTMSDLEPSAPQARWLDARRFSSDASARDLAAWVDTLA